MTIDRTTFESIYAGQPRWEIGRPQKAFIDVADQITGSILDSGCGTGENAFFFAGRGRTVTGIDFLAEPITMAKRKAAERSLTVTFLVMDALTLTDWTERFDNVIDSGLFHVFGDEDRRRYVDGLATVLKPNGRFFFLCFSDEEPGTQGPRRVSRKEIGRAEERLLRPADFPARPAGVNGLEGGAVNGLGFDFDSPGLRVVRPRGVKLIWTRPFPHGAGRFSG